MYSSVKEKEPGKEEENFEWMRSLFLEQRDVKADYSVAVKKRLLVEKKRFER